MVPHGISDGFEEVKKGNAYVEMRGNEVFKMAVNTLGRIVDETLAANRMMKSDIDWLVPHQANTRIISLPLPKKLKMSMDQVVVTVQTSMAIPRLLQFLWRLMWRYATVVSRSQ